MVSRSIRNCWIFLVIVTRLCAADRFEASEPHMGSLTRIVLYADNADQAQRAFVAAFSRIDQLEQILTDYRPGSELSRACDLPRLSPDLLQIIRISQHISEKSRGAFDLSIGPVSHLWRQARAEGHLPDPAALAAARAQVDYRQLRLRGQRLHCGLPHMQLDAGGIAKGYAAEEAWKVLARLGIRRALVALSGDIYAGDPPPGKPGWIIDTPAGRRVLSHRGISTSGALEQHLDSGGIRYSHIVEPRTGQAVQGDSLMTVIARHGALADAWATALSVHPRLHPQDIQILAPDQKKRHK